jgi:hypothetical protein
VAGNRKPHKNHKEAVKIINSDEVEGDRYTMLDEARKDFDEAITNFIINEVNDHVYKEKQENVELKKRVDELEQVIGAAKESNLTRNLKRHFGIDIK